MENMMKKKTKLNSSELYQTQKPLKMREEWILEFPVEEECCIDIRAGDLFIGIVIGILIGIVLISIASLL